MEKWQIALDKFLKEWKNRKDVAGILVCGSYIVGNPSKHSDIDVHIVLKPSINWRERGNKVIDGFLIEYFANPKQQISAYFNQDYKKKTNMTIVQFLTGRVIFDDGTIAEIKKEAKQWQSKNFEKQAPELLELSKYFLWDKLDNLEDNYDKKSDDFLFIYSNYLNDLINEYCKFVNYPIIKEDKALAILSDKKVRKKYLLANFPDNKFANIARKAMCENNRDVAMKLSKKLTKHVFSKMGDFEIDGWKVRTKLNLK